MGQCILKVKVITVKTMIIFPFCNLKAGRMSSRNSVRWREATHQEFLRSISSNVPANVGTQCDTGWVDSFPTSNDITTDCCPTADFTLVTPISCPPCPEKMVLGNCLCTRTYDAGARFELIFMKFACLMRVHPWVNPIVFGNNQLNWTCDPKNQFFWLSFSRYRIFYVKNW